MAVFALVIVAGGASVLAVLRLRAKKRTGPVSDMELHSADDFGSNVEFSVNIQGGKA